MIEPLEPRIAPAALNPAGTVLTYTDIDGDLVKVTFTGGATMSAGDFVFSTGGVDGSTTTKQALTQVSVTGETGGGFTLTAAPQRIGGILQGDSHANIASITALETNLGTVSVDGDVAGIQAGTTTAGDGLGLKSFTALSIGRGSFAATANSTVIEAGTFTVKTDVINATLTFTAGVKAPSIGGNLEETVAGGQARIVSTGEVGSLKIGGSVIARSGGAVGTLSIGGSIIGGIAEVFPVHAQVRITDGSFKTFSVGGDVIGGTGSGGGSISTRGGAV